jgi:hypothetical protein
MQESRPGGRLSAACRIEVDSQLKMAPTVSLLVVGIIVQVFGPAATGGFGLGVQFEDHPPKAPVPAGAVKVKLAPMG